LDTLDIVFLTCLDDCRVRWYFRPGSDGDVQASRPSSDHTHAPYKDHTIEQWPSEHYIVYGTVLITGDNQTQTDAKVEDPVTAMDPGGHLLVQVSWTPLRKGSEGTELMVSCIGLKQFQTTIIES
jgi:hypothetical protein